MVVHDMPLEWYTNKLANKEYFSMGMYGDGEWMAIFKDRVGFGNAENTIYTPELCEELRESLKFKSDNFLFSSPAILKSAKDTHIGEKKIDETLKEIGADVEFYEKDMWDREVRSGGLLPFIKQLQKMNVVIISNEALRGLTFLKYDHFVEIPYPNCHLEMDRVVNECLDYGKPGVYLIAAGLPAALFAQKLHDRIPSSWFLDLGSIWDAFVGIGAQRGWRGEMYADEVKYNNWKQLYAEATV